MIPSDNLFFYIYLTVHLLKYFWLDYLLTPTPPKERMYLKFYDFDKIN